MTPDRGPEMSETMEETTMQRRILMLLAIGIAAGAFTAMLAGSARADRYSECQRYRSLALTASHQNKNLGCRLTGDRWSMEALHHERWCMGLAEADWHFVQAELQARLDMLKTCTAKISQWSQWDRWSASYSGAAYSPSAVGEQECKNFGNQIIREVEEVRRDPSIWDRATQIADGRPGHYLMFHHWNGFRCRQITLSGGGRVIRIEGNVGNPNVEITPKPRWKLPDPRP
jgi:hypothetical protein